MFAAECVTRDIILWCRDAKIAPRAKAEGETDKAYDEYLEKFKPDEEKTDDFKRGYSFAFCQREGRTLHYIRLDEAGKGRGATAEEVAAMVTWLSTEECSFSTGAVFDLSGGRSTY